MEVSRFGDWDRVRELLGNNLGHRMAEEIRNATVKSALLLVREIKRGIRDQAPGGVHFAPLAQVTIDRKGSSKALIDTGFLLNSITEKIMSDRAFVGLLRTSMYGDGQSAANIGAIMEYGATINHPSGAVIVIPARPFLHPTMVKYGDQIMQNYRDALQEIMR